MTPQQMRRAEELFHDLLARPAAERAKVLAGSSADDPIVLENVRELLAHAERPPLAAATVGSPLVEWEPAAEPRWPNRPARIGPYRLIEPIGRGGFGEVYLAEQAQPVRRRVALKLLRNSHDSTQTAARFLAEQAALARMEHPCIAKVYDAGRTESGVPWFAMEFIAGRPLTQYCDQRGLPISDRLRLLVDVCSAVQHAHQRGILHRDLKPSNILVAEIDGRPLPRVIDFGIAKAFVDDTSGAESLLTRDGQFIGTPAYMSPEQASGGAQDVDTRSDMYAIGVVLYEVLTGAAPHAGPDGALPPMLELLERVRSGDVVRPSQRVGAAPAAANIARARGLSPQRLRRLLSRDLDWIVMKAIEKDRERRYASCSELAADIARYLENEPVLARAPSAAYRFRKFVRRHRASVSLAGAAAAALLLGLAGTSYGLVKARAAAARALAEADQKREVVQLLQDGLRFAQPGTGYRADMAVREMLDAVAQRIGETSDPRVRASLLTTIGTAYASLGLFDPALKFLEDARRIRTSLPEPSAADLAESNIELAALYWYRNEAALALDHARAGMRYTEQAFGRDDERYANARNNLGIMLANSGQTEPGLEHLRAALLLRDRILGPVHKWTIQTRLNIGSVLLNARRLDEAAQWLEPALADATAHLPLEEEVRQQATDLLAEYYTASGRSAESVALLEQVVADYRALFGPEHFKLIRPLTALASALKAEQRLDDAVARLHEAQQIGSSRLGDESPETLSVLNDLGLVYESSGRLADAAAVHERVLDARRRVLPPTHFQIAQSASNLAVVRYLSGDPAGALALLRESLPILEREFGSDSPHARLCRQRIARCAERMQPPQGPGAQTEP